MNIEKRIDESLQKYDLSLKVKLIKQFSSDETKIEIILNNKYGKDNHKEHRFQIMTDHNFEIALDLVIKLLKMKLDDPSVSLVNENALV